MARISRNRMTIRRARDFITDLKSNSEGYMEQVDFMLIGLQSDRIVKPLSFSYLASRKNV